MNKTIYTIFKQGSKTYFYSSIFFPGPVKHDVFCLYAFVRKADDFVDAIPQQPEAFYRFKELYTKACRGTPSNDIVIDSFVELMRRKEFDPQWIDAFLNAMELDLTKKIYATLEETCSYMFGSAEVIGLMMSKILGFHPDSYPHARALGRAMQYINFIRDIDEDLQLGRTYLPLQGSGLSTLEPDHVRSHRKTFIRFVREQIDVYFKWQEFAEQGFKYIRKRYLIPIKTASDKYKWTARTLYEDPLLVYARKVKPSVKQILLTGLKNSLMFNHKVIEYHEA